MANRLYSKTLQYIKENYLSIIVLIIFTIISFFPVPYYIHSTGGLINISDRVIVENEHESSGTFNFAYVTEMNGTIMTYLLSFLIRDWDLVRKSEIENIYDSEEEIKFRNTLFLKEANQNAVFVAYNKADKYLNIKNTYNYVVYINKIANTNLKITDQILSINGIDIIDAKDYVDIVNNSEIKDILNIKVKTQNGKIEDKYIEVKEYNNNKVTGIYFITKYDYNTFPNIDFNFSKTESGPSGGFMMTLAIYNKLIEEDITKGKNIVGTGTIDKDGNIGEVGGIKYKLKGAVRKNADIFFVPEKNYEEAYFEKEKNKYDIQIIYVSTFSDALNYLKKI